MIIKLKEYKYEILLLIIILVYIFFLSGITGQLKSPPGPILGGDLYHQQGAIYHVMESNISTIFDSSNTLDGRPSYFYTYSIINGFLGNLLDKTPFESMIISSYLILIFSLIISYLLFYKIFNNKLISLFGIVVLISFQNFPVFKDSPFFKLFFKP